MSNFGEIDIMVNEAISFIKEGYSYWESVNAVSAEWDLTTQQTCAMIHLLAKEGYKNGA